MTAGNTTTLCIMTKPQCENGYRVAIETIVQVRRAWSTLLREFRRRMGVAVNVCINKWWGIGGE